MRGFLFEMAQNIQRLWLQWTIPPAISLEQQDSFINQDRFRRARLISLIIFVFLLLDLVSLPCVVLSGNTAQRLGFTLSVLFFVSILLCNYRGKQTLAGLLVLMTIFGGDIVLPIFSTQGIDRTEWASFSMLFIWIPLASVLFSPFFSLCLTLFASSLYILLLVWAPDMTEFHRLIAQGPGNILLPFGFCSLSLWALATFIMRDLTKTTRLATLNQNMIAYERSQAMLSTLYELLLHRLTNALDMMLEDKKGTQALNTMLVDKKETQIFDISIPSRLNPIMTLVDGALQRLQERIRHEKVQEQRCKHLEQAIMTTSQRIHTGQPLQQTGTSLDRLIHELQARQ